MRKARPRLGLAPLAALAAVGCDAGPPAPTLRAVAPDRGYTDRDLRMVLTGAGFLPSYRIDPASGRRLGETAGFSGLVECAGGSARLGRFGWRSADELTATLAPGLPPGPCRVTVTDPRGQKTALERGFVALGPDRTPPLVRFDAPAPGTPVAAGMVLAARLSATDEAPGGIVEVAWDASTARASLARGVCSPEADQTAVSCALEVPLPDWLEPGEVLELRAAAADAAAQPNRAETRLALQLRPKPSVSAVAPARGGAAGGTDVIIRGAGFVPGSRAFVDDVPLVPNGGVLVDDGTISGRTPPHWVGTVNVTVRTPIGAALAPSAFSYLPAPQIEAIAPEAADADGGTPVRVRGRYFTDETRVYFGIGLAGAIPLHQPRFVDETEIRGFAPAGRGRTSVWALDPDLGWTRLVDGFVWGEAVP